MGGTGTGIGPVRTGASQHVGARGHGRAARRVSCRAATGTRALAAHARSGTTVFPGRPQLVVYRQDVDGGRRRGARTVLGQ